MSIKVTSYYPRKDGRFNGDAMSFELCNSDFSFKVWFSYETPIAFRLNDILAISENVYSQTTAKHLKAIDPDFRKKCVDTTAFNNRLETILASIGIKSS